MSHRLAAVRTGLWGKKLADAKALLAVLPPPCADVGVEGCAELLLRIQVRRSCNIQENLSVRTNLKQHTELCLPLRLHQSQQLERTACREMSMSAAAGAI